MQARTAWSPPVGVLGRLCAAASRRAEALAAESDVLRQRALEAPGAPGLERALRSGTDLRIIAEVKRRSPSRGVLNAGISAADRASEYEQGGAAAISVLTEPGEFGGSNGDLVEIRQRVALPVLRKDFHVSPLQVWEARSIGASAVLLIVRALGPDGTQRLARVAVEAGIEALFEVRDEAELECAIDAGARIIGVNRRNLETLELEDGVPARLLPRIPATCVAVAESGIRTLDDVDTVARQGADAILVGSSLSMSSHARDGVAALTGVQRRGRRA